MSVSVFDLKLVEPDDKMLTVELGDTRKYLDKIGSFIKEEYGDLSFEWKFYGQKSGWVLKMYNKKRNVLFIVPLRGFFKAVFTLGDKAADNVIESDLPHFIKYELIAAKKYSEGRTIQLEIKSDEQCEYALKLIRIKMKN